MMQTNKQKKSTPLRILLTWKISMKGERERESGAALNRSHFDSDVCFPLPRDDARQPTTHVPAVSIPLMSQQQVSGAISSQGSLWEEMPLGCRGALSAHPSITLLRLPTDKVSGVSLLNSPVS